MNILIESRSFHPNIGGLEMMAEGLSRAWQHQGHDVCIMTETLLEEKDEIVDLEVMRQPSRKQWFSKLRQADVFFQNGVSLNSLPLSILANTPVVFRHPNLLGGGGSRIGKAKEWIKRMSTYLGYNIAPSHAVQRRIPGRSTVVPNMIRSGYRDAMKLSDEQREYILFVGRLSKYKGCEVLIRALAFLNSKSQSRPLVICGDGPDRIKLEKLTRQLGIDHLVTFEGWTRPDELIHYYQNAWTTVFPSYYEAFGIVAIEAIACGSPVVATDRGGLPEAVGKCGVLCKNISPESIACGIEKVNIPEKRSELRSHMKDHTSKHYPEVVAEQYLTVMKQSL